MAENGIFRGPKAPFSVLEAGALEHKPLIWPLLCRPTFLAAQSKSKCRAPFRARQLFRRDVRRRIMPQVPRISRPAADTEMPPRWQLRRGEVCSSRRCRSTRATAGPIRVCPKEPDCHPKLPAFEPCHFWRPFVPSRLLRSTFTPGQVPHRRPHRRGPFHEGPR